MWRSGFILLVFATVLTACGSSSVLPGVELATRFEVQMQSCQGSSSNGAVYADCGEGMTQILRDALAHGDNKFTRLGPYQDRSGKWWTKWQVKGHIYYLTYPFLAVEQTATADAVKQ